jgi:CheY-like chemotaxis protein
MTRVLVVEDETIIGKLVQEILQDEGYFVQSADNAAAAFGCIAQQWPDVMLLDVHMSAMDGWTFLRACRQDPRGADLRVVVMSPHGRTIGPRNWGWRSCPSRSI